MCKTNRSADSSPPLLTRETLLRDNPFAKRVQQKKSRQKATRKDNRAKPRTGTDFPESSLAAPFGCTP